MSHDSHGHQTLQAWLKVTLEQELDCDEFAALLAPWLDQRIDDPKLRALLEHHRRLCVECDEEASLVEAALGDRSG
jgi:urease accessory protein UreF